MITSTRYHEFAVKGEYNEDSGMHHIATAMGLGSIQELFYLFSIMFHRRPEE